MGRFLTSDDFIAQFGEAEAWTSWGETAGKAVGAVVNYVVDLVGKIADLVGWLKSAWDWAQASESDQRERVAQLASRPVPKGPSGGPFGIAVQRNANAAANAARAAAVTSAVAIGGPLAAETPTVDGSRYVTTRSTGNTSVSAPVTIKIEGNVDRDVMPDLETLAERTADKVEERLRESQRRGHN